MLLFNRQFKKPPPSIIVNYRADPVFYQMYGNINFLLFEPYTSYIYIYH